ncbi:MAG: hypothetical protein KatS3mg076_1336 [Candidatus Binatia bacterium]|nr:MAG: hypothetical protein KatS3mg076_1336 [Candidatus Binatia bacterium]
MNPRSLLGSLLEAFRFLLPTLLGASSRVPSRGAAALFFPICGVALGAVLLLVDRSLGGAATHGAALAEVVVFLLLTGATHERALYRIVASRARNPAFVWLPGAVVFLCLAARFVCYATLEARRQEAFLFAPLLGRWAMVVSAYGNAVRPSEHASFVRGIGFSEFGWASVLACAVVFHVWEAFGIFLVTVLAAATVGLRWILRRLGGVDPEGLLAAGTFVEILALGIVRIAPGT